MNTVKTIVLGLSLTSFVWQSGASLHVPENVPEKIKRRSLLCSAALSLATGVVIGGIAGAASRDGEVAMLVLLPTAVLTFVPYYNLLVQPYWVKWTALARYNVEKNVFEDVARKFERYKRTGVLPKEMCSLNCFTEILSRFVENLEVIIYEMADVCNIKIYEKCEILQKQIRDLLNEIDLFTESHESEVVVLDASTQTEEEIKVPVEDILNDELELD